MERMRGPVPNIFSRGSAKAHMSWLEKVFSAKGDHLHFPLSFIKIK
jgi:hypothetical protein